MLSVSAQTMEERTSRYPRYKATITLLRASSFPATAPVTLGGDEVHSRDLTARLLVPLWQLSEDDADVTLMGVAVGACAHVQVLVRAQYWAWRALLRRCSRRAGRVGGGDTRRSGRCGIVAA